MHRNTWIGFALATVLTACGGHVVLDGISGETTGTGTGTGGAGNTSSSSSTSSSTGIGGATLTSTGVTTGVSAVSTGTQGGSTNAIATSTDGSSGTSSGLPPGAQPIYCNSQPCQTGEICCFNLMNPTDHCGQTGTCGAGYIELSCSGPTDCAGSSVCCGNLDMNVPMGTAPYTSVSCQPSCNGQNQVVICDPQSPNLCPQGTQCQQSQVLGQGYSVCR